MKVVFDIREMHKKHTKTGIYHLVMTQLLFKYLRSCFLL